jgi:hypothetical protein
MDGRNSANEQREAWRLRMREMNARDEAERRQREQARSPFSGDAYLKGVEQHAGIRVYSAEKTLADCFKYRNTLGMALVLQALKDWAGKRGKDVNALVRFAKICRVERVMRPYLEALL